MVFIANIVRITRCTYFVFHMGIVPSVYFDWEVEVLCSKFKHRNPLVFKQCCEVFFKCYLLSFACSLTYMTQTIDNSLGGNLYSRKLVSCRDCCPKFILIVHQMNIIDHWLIWSLLVDFDLGPSQVLPVLL